MAARGLALAAVIFALLGGTADAACTAPAKSTSHELSGNETQGDVSNQTWQAQSFKVPSAIQLSKVSLNISNPMSQTTGVTVQVRSDAGDTPGAVITSTARHLANTTESFQDFVFPAAVVLVPGTTYWIVATGSGTVSEGYRWTYDTAGDATYADGHGVASFNQGSTWETGTGSLDFNFQVWGQVCVADTPVPPATAALSQLGLSRTTFAAASSGPSAIARKKRTPVGTRVGYTLNEAASVSFKVTRRVRGRRVKRGKRRVCVKPTRKNRHKRRCTRTVTLKGGFTRTGAAGANSFRFTGRLRGRKLKPGRYRLVATPSANGVKGKPVSRAFRIIR
jgi:hypothetical protein